MMKNKDIWTKIHKSVIQLRFAYRVYKNIDKTYGLFLIYWFFKQKLRLLKRQDWEKRHILIKKILHKEFDNYLTTLTSRPIFNTEKQNTESSPYDGSIWIYWNNPSTMPAIVKSCISSIYKNSNGKKIIVLNENTLQDYIHIEKHIIEKYRAGFISKTHFSDIVRISLLARYGGIWMDATILQTHKMPDYVERNDFFTFKLKIDKPWETISHGNWCVFFIACKKGNLLIETTKEMMNEYWKKYDILIDYLWMDYLWMITSEKIPAIKNMLSQIPQTNPNLFSLKNLDKICTDKEYQEKTQQTNTCFYKLSYKSTIGIPLRNKNEKLTLLGQIIEHNQ